MRPLTYDIGLDTITSGYDRQTCWVHARSGAIPGGTPAVVVLMQKLLLSKNDVFFALNEMRSDDMGKTWKGPISHERTLGRRKQDDGTEMCPCDFNPQWHQKTGKLLGIGHSAVYRDNDPIPPSMRRRSSCYSIYDADNRVWSPFSTLDMPRGGLFDDSGAGCVQRYDLPDGDILLPIYFSSPFAVTVLRCGFDGRTLRYISHGNILKSAAGRGLCEPSITFYQGKYYLTIRNDLAGFVSSSEDGIVFSPPKQWCFDDGSDLGSYNTQQHWVTHSDGLFLVYTRRGANNDNVFRHRAPLFMARVHPERHCVIRETERILVPNRGARLGNFQVTDVSRDETWVVVAEWMQSIGANAFDPRGCEKYGSDNSVFAARIRWDKPNLLLPPE